MKDLLTSLRASNETYNSMKHSARAIIRRAEIPLLAVIVLYKAATNLLFVPLMQQLWSLTLRFAPMHYLSNNNASDIFSSPAIILCITLIAILTAFWALYEFSVLLHGLDLARKGETIRLPALLRTSLADIRHAFLPQNWLVLVYSAVLIPFTNFFLAYNYITQLAVPEYIMGVIRANSRYYLLYLAAGAALLFLCVSWVLVLPLFVLERKSLWQSVKESFCCIRRRVFRAFLLLLRWNLSVVLRSLLLTAAVAVPLYGIIIAVGLQSTQAMFALSRAALAIEMPFFQFLIDCAITMAQCTILAMLHCRLRESLPSEPEPVQSGKHLFIAEIWVACINFALIDIAGNVLRNITVEHRTENVALEIPSVHCAAQIIRNRPDCTVQLFAFLLFFGVYHFYFLHQMRISALFSFILT